MEKVREIKNVNTTIKSVKSLVSTDFKTVNWKNFPNREN